jgi:ATP-dependent Clp protease ATP-binding subunit ClpA
MSDFQRIEYYDLKCELTAGRLPFCIGRSMEISRLMRILSRSMAHHAVIIGSSGVGKTSFLHGFVREAANNKNFAKTNIAMVNTTSLQRISSLASTNLTRYQEAFSHIKNSIVIFDDFGTLASLQPGAIQNWLIILQPLLEKNDLKLLFTMTPEQHQWLEKNAAQFFTQIEILHLSEQPDSELLEILDSALQKIVSPTKNIIAPGGLELVVSFIRRFPKLGQLPKAGIQLLDECWAEAKTTLGTASMKGSSHTHPVLRHLEIQKARTKTSNITPEIITRIVSEKVDVPLQSLTRNERESLKMMPDLLQRHIVGQGESISIITGAIQRAKLGLRSTARPLASFLLLGPSGVGKTETAKLLSSHLYGRPESFLRIDMSEFGEAHTVQRLIGAPPGYMGFDSGGQLTNHIKQSPYSLVLLDEIEKAHAKIFDVFLQLLDDGRLTSGQGETVDATQSIIMATSNLGVEEIITAHTAGSDVHDPLFIKNTLIPILAKNFRMEFLNRFDALLVYNPLSVSNLTDIALLEIKKIEQRTAEHHISFRIDRATLEKKVAQLADPRFGARPIKRFIEEMCEGLITEQLLK